MSRGNDAFDAAHPDFDGCSSTALARAAVEFEYQLRLERCADLFYPDDPPSRFYWTVRLGRLALRRDGSWSYHARATSDSARDAESLEFLRAQRFVRLEDAVAAATRALGGEPPHAAWARYAAEGLEKNEEQAG